MKEEPKKLWYEYRISKDITREGYFYGPGAPAHLVGKRVVFIGEERLQTWLKTKQNESY